MARKIKVVERKLGRENALGQACQEERLVEIDPRQPAREYLDTLLHELLHVQFPELTEEQVAKTANEMTGAVWAAGYRRLAK